MCDDMKKCEWCGEEFPPVKRSPRKKYCSTLCRVYWNYHNNEKYRESHLITMSDRYYADREKWREKQDEYKKREGWEGNLMSKGKTTKRRHLYDLPDLPPTKKAINKKTKEEMSKKEDKEFFDRFDFGDIDFGFDFTAFNPEKGEGE